MKVEKRLRLVLRDKGSSHIGPFDEGPYQIQTILLYRKVP